MRPVAPLPLPAGVSGTTTAGTKPGAEASMPIGAARKARRHVYSRLGEIPCRRAVADISRGPLRLSAIIRVTILSGALQVSLPLFVVSAILARGARFFALAWLLRRYGAPIQDFIERRLGLIASGVAAAIILLYVAARFA
jgi:hypothetical protein